MGIRLPARTDAAGTAPPRVDALKRKNTFDALKESLARGPYDEMPMLELGIDPQLHLSRNTIAQPFFLICAEDTMIVQLAGAARIEFKNSSVNYFDTEAGDFVYVPGGTPSRIVPKSESVHLRYKAANPSREAVAWYSERTGQEIARVEWDCAEELAQEAYLRACRAFNADARMRTCPTTGAVAPAIDFAPFRWAQIATEIKEAEAAERARQRKKGVERAEAPRPGAAAPPDSKEPLKTNGYAHARMSTAMLSPLFPYFGPGSIVPCASMFGSKHEPTGYFVHHNTVQEVLLCLGARGAPYPYAGMVRVGPLTHPVGNKPDQPAPPESNVLVIITQRQAVDEEQREAIFFFCAKCDNELFRRDYGANEFPDALEGPVDAQIIGLPTISQSAASAVAFNESLDARTCKKCGHVNEPFPHLFWGWEEYRRRTRVAVTVRSSLHEAAAAARAGAAK